MKLSILTIAPEMFAGLEKDHVIERAVSLGRLTVEVTDIRTYAPGSFRAVDDSPYGGGAGMILRVEPIMRAIRAADPEGKAHVAVLTPIGKPYTQETARRLKEEAHLILICGHYEGIDARVLSHAHSLLSIGDYVLSGGEIAAMAVADSVARLMPGVLKAESLQEESFTSGLLEYPQYTRPASYEGQCVPPILLSGDHGAIRRWREEQAREITRKYRPDLLAIE